MEINGYNQNCTNENLDTNVFNLDKLSELEEIVEILKENENIKIEKIISTGQVTDWMEQDKEEFVILLQGEAIIEFDKNVTKKLKKGDTITIKQYQKHRVTYTSKNPCCIWICVFY